MKGVKKCFLFSFILMAVSLVSCLGICSPNTYAKKHEINTIPIASLADKSSLSVTFNSDFLPSNFGSNVKSPRLFHTKYDSSSQKCIYYNNAWDYSYNNGSISFWSASPLNVTDSSLSVGAGSPICNQLSKFGEGTMPNFSDSGLPAYAFGRPDYRSMLPYWYDYDAYALHASRTDTSSGITYNYKFKFSDVYGVNLNKFLNLQIPLGYVESGDTFGSFSQGRPIQIQGVFDFSGDGNTFAWSPDIDTKGYFNLVATSWDIDDSNPTVAYTYPCSANLRSLSANNFIQLEFTCDFELSRDSDYVSFNLDIGTRSNDYKYVWDTNADYSFSTSYLVTDNDETPGAPMSQPVTGGNTDLSPAESYLDAMLSGDGVDISSILEDLFENLKNLFTFNILNPFDGFFQLFTNNNSCVEIPIIAGMLGSQNSTYCPWFSSPTRDILTPVLGISSVMLLFGFIVRWLRSSSSDFSPTSSGGES